MTHIKKYMLALALLSLHYSTMPRRGRVTAYVIGRNSAENNYYRSDEDRARKKQIDRHEKDINQHKKEIQKLKSKSNKKLDEEIKQKEITKHESEIEKSEKRIQDLL